jgi:hypothetical protein
MVNENYPTNNFYKLFHIFDKLSNVENILVHHKYTLWKYYVGEKLQDAIYA